MVLALIFLVLGLVAGFGLYLELINRTLSYMRHRVSKPLVSLTALLILLGGFAFLGFAGGAPGRWLVCVTLFGLILAELYMLRVRRRYIGAPPVARTGPAQSVFRPVTTTDLALFHYIVSTGLTTEKEFQPSQGCQSAERRLRVTHISDLHVNNRLGRDYYQRVMECANQTAPDLIFITGDFVTDTESAQHLPDLLRILRSRYGIFAILGNHDYWADPDVVTQAVSSVGIELIGNGYRRLCLDGDTHLTILGCEEPWSVDRWSPPMINNGDLALALSHSADQVYRLSQAGADAVFSGHYHAGQFQLPFFGPLLVPSRYGRRFYHGHYKIGPTHLFVSAGAGASNPAVRLYCPPDLLLVDFCLDQDIQVER